MGKIRLLATHEIQKIAAGEVVERPANAVKELLENALDAGATQIEISLEDGGRELIQITDNGSGIAAEELPLAIAPHATSKITAVDDLALLATFGFRGEALASLAAVSDLTVTSRTAIEESATTVQTIFGAPHSTTQTMHRVGTTVTVRQLFTNVPARRKFLKSADSEWVQLKQLLQAYALTYLPLHIIVRHNGTIVYNCSPTTTIVDRMAQLLDIGVAQQCHLLTATTAQATIWGACSNHQVTRFNRQHIFITVNNRWVKNQQLSKAILRGYQGVLPQGKFPVVVLHIQVPPAHVDVNVHPRKEEVQLLYSAAIESMITKEITRQLEDAAFRGLQQSGNHGVQERSSGAAIIDEIFVQPSQAIAVQRPIVQTAMPVPGIAEQKIIPAGEKQLPWVDRSWRIIGTVAATYILLETTEGLWIVDQHAAHERILFEELGKRTTAPAATKLVTPITITGTTSQITDIARWQAILAGYGIEIMPISATQGMITAVPATALSLDMQEFMREFFDLIAQESAANEHNGDRISWALQAQMACKAAVKAGDKLTLYAQEQLIEKLLISPHRLTCPHGRPTTWVISHYDIAKKFKRVTT